MLTPSELLPAIAAEGGVCAVFVACRGERASWLCELVPLAGAGGRRIFERQLARRDLVLMGCYDARVSLGQLREDWTSVALGDE